MEIANDPEVFLALDDLELSGRGIAESVWSGMHRSTVRGPGVEFDTHRDYQPGDDLRCVNWALYARQRRLFTKESKKETRRPVYLLLDASGSMQVAHGAFSKIDYARRMLAALAFLSVRQGDCPALGVFRGTLDFFIPPKSGNRHAMRICAGLAQANANGEGHISQALQQCHAHCRSRGFIVLISDFFDQESEIISELTTLRVQGHDVLALQILDPYEVKMPAAGDYEFVDAETGKNFRTSAEPIQAAHAKTVADWRTELQREARAKEIRWKTVTTDDPFSETARKWLRSED